MGPWARRSEARLGVSERRQWDSHPGPPARPPSQNIFSAPSGVADSRSAPAPYRHHKSTRPSWLGDRQPIPDRVALRRRMLELLKQTRDQRSRELEQAKAMLRAA
jgi:hypothetical protein